MSNWVSHCLDGMVRRLEELLHGLMILIQKGIQLSDQLLGVGLGLRKLGFDAVDFGVQVLRHLIHVDEEAVLVLLELDLKQALVRVL